MFIDRAIIEVRSGKGGDGMIAFRREKYVAKGGPAGGNGGRGGSVILKANSRINTLFNFRHSKAFIAKEGEKGGIKNQFGKYAEDGGTNKDGVIELRRGVPDLSLGGARYAQVRIAVDDTHYLKGMALYSDNRNRF